MHRFGEVWRFVCDEPIGDDHASLTLPLPIAERAARFVRDAERTRYLNAHRMLHAALMHHEPELVWSVGANGKPLVGAHARAFNLSRRGAWAAFVIGPDATPVGIDLEVLHGIDDPLGLAHDHFTPIELQALHDTPAAERSHAFLRGWTRKEAVMKAVGLGVTLPARSFHVGLDAMPVSIEVRHDAQAWQVELESLPDIAPTVMAVARCRALR